MSQPQRPERFVKEGPASSCVIDGKALGWTNCTPAGTAMGLNKATYGRIDIDDCEIRRRTGDTVGGTNLEQMQKVCTGLGVKTELHVGANVATPTYLVRQGRAGRGACWQGNTSALLKTKFRSTGGKVNHNVYVNEFRGGTADVPAEALVYDPAADGRTASWGTAAKGPQWWPFSLLLAFAAALQPRSDTGGVGSSGPSEYHLGPGKVYSLIFPDTEPHAHLWTGARKATPFPDRQTIKSPDGPRYRVNVRTGPSKAYAVATTLADGAVWTAFQYKPDGGLDNGTRGWYGNHDGNRWVHESGLVNEGGSV